VSDTYIRAAESYVQAMRTGEGSAARQATAYLADDVALIAGGERIVGRDQVSARITGQWPMTPVYLRATWSNPTLVDHTVKVEATSRDVFAPVPRFELAFRFNDQQQIREIEQIPIERSTPSITDTIPDYVKSYVNNALANGTPMVIACTNPDGSPNLTLRGATQVFSDTQLSVWLRHAEGDTVKAIRLNPKMAALYRDSRNRTTLVFHGHGYVASDEATRNRAFEIAPEVEQNHDPNRLGAALIIDVERLDGMSAHGVLQLRRTV
jgi:hypothetical protein